MEGKCGSTRHLLDTLFEVIFLGQTTVYLWYRCSQKGKKTKVVDPRTAWLSVVNNKCMFVKGILGQKSSNTGNCRNCDISTIITGGLRNP